MNCKPGEMAMVIRGRPENIGKVVTVLRLADMRINRLDEKVGPFWVIDRDLMHQWEFSKRLTMRPFCADCKLMPIHPLDDETILETTSLEIP